jgi:hypothetical protein
MGQSVSPRPHHQCVRRQAPPGPHDCALAQHDGSGDAQPQYGAVAALFAREDVREEGASLAEICDAWLHVIDIEMLAYRVETFAVLMPREAQADGTCESVYRARERPLDAWRNLTDEEEEDLEPVEGSELIEHGGVGGQKPVGPPPAKWQRRDNDDLRTLRCAGMTKKNWACQLKKVPRSQTTWNRGRH